MGMTDTWDDFGTSLMGDANTFVGDTTTDATNFFDMGIASANTAAQQQLSNLLPPPQAPNQAAVVPSPAASAPTTAIPHSAGTGAEPVSQFSNGSKAVGLALVVLFGLILVKVL